MADEAAAPPARPLRKNRDFVTLWSGQTVSAIGSSMSTLVFPLIGYAITGSALKAGLATAAVLLGQTLAQLPAGALTDRWARSRVLVIANLVSAATLASLAIAAAVGELTLAHLIVAGVLAGIAEAFLGPAAAAALRVIVPKEQLPVALTRMQVQTHTANLIGPPLGGALFSLARAVPFAFDAVSFAAYGLAASRFRTPLPAPDGPQSTIGKGIAEGVRFVWHTAALRAIMLWAGAANFSGIYVFILINLRLIRAGVHPAAIGAIDTVASVAGLLGSFAAPAIVRRTPTGLLTISTGLVFALLVVPMGLTTNVVIIGALAGVGSLLIPANNSGVSAYSSTVTPHRLQARVFAGSNVIASGLSPAAPALAGGLLALLGGFTATLVGAALCVASLLPLLLTRDVLTLGPPDTWRSAEEVPSTD